MEIKWKIKILIKLIQNKGKMEHVYTSGGNIKWCSNFGEQSSSSSNKHRVSYDTAILLLGKHPREIKAYDCIKTYIWMFIATLCA